MRCSTLSTPRKCVNAYCHGLRLELIEPGVIRLWVTVARPGRSIGTSYDRKYVCVGQVEGADGCD